MNGAQILGKSNKCAISLAPSPCLLQPQAPAGKQNLGMYVCMLTCVHKLYTGEWREPSLASAPYLRYMIPYLPIPKNGELHLMNERESSGEAGGGGLVTASLSCCSWGR